jgi:hypothetical protein
MRGNSIICGIERLKGPDFGRERIVPLPGADDGAIRARRKRPHDPKVMLTAP